MTYEELTEVGDTVFEEYLPKVSGKLRKEFLDALFTELEEQGALDVDDEIVQSEDEDLPDDEE